MDMDSTHLSNYIFFSLSNKQWLSIDTYLIDRNKNTTCQLIPMIRSKKTNEKKMNLHI
jgi:hypothetical protein